MISIILFMLTYLVGSCLLFYSGTFYVAETDFNDRILQKGVASSGKVIAIEIGDEDKKRLNKELGEIAAELIDKLSYVVDDRTVIGLDVNPKEFAQEDIEVIENSLSRFSNIVMQIDVDLGADFFIKNTGFSSQEIYCAKEENYIDSNELRKLDSGHNLKLKDTGGTLRHALFDIQGEDHIIESFAYVCYEEYCEANDIECSKPLTNPNKTAIIKFVKNENQTKEYSASDILEGKLSKEDLSGIVILIGSIDHEDEEGYLTSGYREDLQYGVDVDANIVGNLLTGKTAVEMPVLIQIVIFVVAAILLFALIPQRKFLSRLIVAIVYELLTIMIGAVSFGLGSYGFMLPHIFSGSLGVLIISFVSDQIKNAEIQKELRSALSRYMDTEVADDIISRGNNYRHSDLSGESVSSKKIAILFADIRGFTSLSESVPPETLVDILNQYLSMMSECVSKYQGTLDKYIGDCTMAYWGAPLSDDDAAYHACLAAIEMQRRSRELSIRMNRLVGHDILIGIGINYGEAIVGNIGSSSRQDYTAVGDAVNVASRLENAAPEGLIYISESVKNELKERGETTALPKKLILKGKKESVSVYELNTVVSQSRMHSFDAEKENTKLFYRKRAYEAAVCGVAVLIPLLVSVFNAFRTNGIEFCNYLPTGMSAICMAIMIAVLSYDLRAAENADGKSIRPRILDILLLPVLAMNVDGIIYFALAMFVDRFSLVNYVADWPGSLLFYLYISAISLLAFFRYENKAHYKLRDIAYGELLIFAIALLGRNLSRRASSGTVDLLLQQNYYSYASIAIMMIFNLIFMIFIYFLYEKHHWQVKLKDVDIFESEANRKSRRTQNILSRFIEKIFSSHRNEQMLYLSFDILILIISLRCIIKSILRGGIAIFSNPSMLCILISICAIYSIVCEIITIIDDSKRIFPKWYKYLSLLKMMANAMNFNTVLLLAISGEGLGAFITPHWNADFLNIIVAPAIASIMLIMQNNKFELKYCIITALPMVCLLPISRTAIFYYGLQAKYTYEISNFYTIPVMIGIGFAEIAATIAVYFVNNTFRKPLRYLLNLNTKKTLSVCGCRYGLTKSGPKYYEFGQKTSCYVIRDGNYGLVLDAGSGLEAASEKLKGCTDVDILISNNSFFSLMGFLVAPNIAPEARIRIFAPFSYSGKMENVGSFVAHPFWPANVVVGRNIAIEPMKKIILNDSYEARFIPLDIENKNYLIRITGDADIGYIGNYPSDSINIAPYIKDANMLICDCHESLYHTCMLSIDCDIRYLIVTGHDASLSDEVLREGEETARKNFADIGFARQGEEYFLDDDEE